MFAYVPFFHYFCFFLLIYVLCFVVALCWGPPPVVNNQRCLCTHLWDVQRDEIALAKNGSRTKHSTPNLLAILINSKVFKPTKSRFSYFLKKWGLKTLLERGCWAAGVLDLLLLRLDLRRRNRALPF